MILVDSTVWIDYFNGKITLQRDYLDRILPAEPILVGDLILAEVLQGFRRDSDFDKASRALGRRRKIFVRDIQTDSVFETESVSQSGTILYCQAP